MVAWLDLRFNSHNGSIVLFCLFFFVFFFKQKYLVLLVWNVSLYFANVIWQPFALTIQVNARQMLPNWRLVPFFIRNGPSMATHIVVARV